MFCIQYFGLKSHFSLSIISRPNWIWVVDLIWVRFRYESIQKSYNWGKIYFYQRIQAPKVIFKRFELTVAHRMWFYMRHKLDFSSSGWIWFSVVCIRLKFTFQFLLGSSLVFYNCKIIKSIYKKKNERKEEKCYQTNLS